MPGVNGFDVLARLPRSGRPPVVVVTSDDTPQSRQWVVNAGAAAFLRKPVDGKALLRAVAAVIVRQSVSRS